MRFAIFFEPQSILAILSMILVAVNLATIAIAWFRLSRRTQIPVPAAPPQVSIVIPSRGIEPFTAETLSRAFALDWPHYELIFCVAEDDDPVIVEIEKARCAHPGVPARLIIGDDRISGNPKLNNCVKGWRAARSRWVILADSNVLMPPDYIQAMMAAWRPDSGLVCSTPIGARPLNFWAQVECAWLNTLQARWQYAGEAVGMGFAQGKSMLWNKPLLDANGSIQALAAEIAEDAASTKLINRIGLKVHLVDAPFEQPLGQRGFWDVWARQARWARLRRVTFPRLYCPEILLGALAPFLLAISAAVLAGEGALWATAVIPVMYVPEYALARAKGWTYAPGYLIAIAIRDLMIPAIWLRGWLGAKVEWRGNAMDIRPSGQEQDEALIGS